MVEWATMSDGSNETPEFDPLVVEQVDPGGPGSARSSRWFLVAAGVVAIAVAVMILAVPRDVADRASDRASDGAATATDTTTTLDTGDRVADGMVPSEPPVTLAPVVTAHPIDWTVVDVSDRVPPTVSTASDAARWNTWSIPVPAVVDEIAVPTEVVVLTANGVLHIIELPSGQVRSRAVPSVSTDGQIALGSVVVAVPQFSGVVLVANDGSLVPIDASPTQPPRVVALGALDRFLVTGGRSNADGIEQQWAVETDGTVTEIAQGPFVEATPWDRALLPSGELLVRRGGGVDAIDIDGSVRGIDDGEVVAVGRNHYAVRRCDSVCDYTVVEVSSGERTVAALTALDDYRFYDTSMRLSPDGRYLQFADWRREQPIVRVVSVADGSVLDAGQLAVIRAPDAWAPDSSGVFTSAGDYLAFRSVDGRVGAVVGLGPIRSVAARPIDRAAVPSG